MGVVNYVVLVNLDNVHMAYFAGHSMIRNKTAYQEAAQQDKKELAQTYESFFRRLVSKAKENQGWLSEEDYQEISSMFSERISDLETS